MNQTSTGLPKARAVFIPRGVVLNGPPTGFRSWKQPGAILAWLRLKGFDAEVFVNWTRARVAAGLPEYRPPYAPGPGYWVYYYGPDPTPKALQRALQ